MQYFELLGLGLDSTSHNKIIPHKFEKNCYKKKTLKACWGLGTIANSIFIIKIRLEESKKENMRKKRKQEMRGCAFLPTLLEAKLLICLCYNRPIITSTLIHLLRTNNNWWCSSENLNGHFLHIQGSAGDVMLLQGSTPLRWVSCISHKDRLSPHLIYGLNSDLKAVEG